MSQNIYKRVMLKISGESLVGEKDYGISSKIIKYVAEQIGLVVSSGVQIAIVIGAGNIFRGASGAIQGIERATADSMGMLATVINCLAMQDALAKYDIECRVLSAIVMPSVCESFNRINAIKYLENGCVVLFAAGTGNPYFTTDTAAVLRALEINADVVFKATRVDGIYDRDPEKFSEAVFLPHITYSEVLNNRLRIMDTAAFYLASENSLPMVVFNLLKKGNIVKAANGELVGTIVNH